MTLKLKPGRLNHPINDPEFVEGWYKDAGRYLALCRHCGVELQVFDPHAGIWHCGFGEEHCDVEGTQRHAPLNRCGLGGVRKALQHQTGI